MKRYPDEHDPSLLGSLRPLVSFDVAEGCFFDLARSLLRCAPALDPKSLDQEFVACVVSISTTLFAWSGHGGILVTNALITEAERAQCVRWAGILGSIGVGLLDRHDTYYVFFPCLEFLLAEGRSLPPDVAESCCDMAIAAITSEDDPGVLVAYCKVLPPVQVLPERALRGLQRLTEHYDRDVRAAALDALERHAQ